MKYIAKRTLTFLVTLLLVSIGAFLAFSIIPGDAALVQLGTEATPEALAALRAQLGLDLPLFTRYVQWLGQFLFGDMGQSHFFGMSVREMLSDRLVITGTLLTLSAVILTVLALPLGLFAGHRRHGKGMVTTITEQVFMAMPPLFLGILLTFVFGVVLRLFVPSAVPSPREDFAGFLGHLFFPALAIALPKAAMATRIIRTAVADELQQDYVLTAHSRGNTRYAVLFRHILPNVAVPAITFLLLALTMMITDAIVVEHLFSIHGLGRLLVSAIGNRDYPVVQALVMLIAAMVIALNFLTDILCRTIDPRLTR